MRLKASVVACALVAVVSGFSRPSTGFSQAASQTRPSAITLPVILAIEDARAPTDADLQILLQATRPEHKHLRRDAIRALGRLERRDVIAALLPFLSPAMNRNDASLLRAEAANAVVQALRGEEPPGVPHGQQEQAVFDALVAAGNAELLEKSPPSLSEIARSIGRFPYERPDQFIAAETFLRRILETPFQFVNDMPHVGAARGLESLARLRRKIGTLDDDTTVVRLRRQARVIDPKRAQHRYQAFAALVSAQKLDEETLEMALGSTDAPDLQRLAMIALAGSGSIIESNEVRADHIRKVLSDGSAAARIEAVRAWARRGAPLYGCGVLLDLFDYPSLDVILVLLDTLGDACRDDPHVTERVLSETRTPPIVGNNWQREAHAFVALAKRAPDRAAIAMSSFASHPTWQVRMYAARGAALLNDVETLKVLATDPEENVAEVTLPPLRRLLGAESDTLFIAALNRRNRPGASIEPARPYQLIRTAAMALDGAESTPYLVRALSDALERISAERCETSRDARVALIERLSKLGSPTQAPVLVPLLKDVDPVIARAAATLLHQWTGKAQQIDTPPRPARVFPDEAALRRPATIQVEMENGGRFAIRLDEGAPLSRLRLKEVIEAPKPYFDGLTFHRVVPNFVIQGGSPGANEYCGACPFMRDELGLASHTAGAVGISTRGRDTGDAQIFINLVDNPRLDHNYTVIGYLCRFNEAVQRIQEGDRIKHAQFSYARCP